jgi:hypothetical protein
MLHCRKRKQFAQSDAESESIRIQETQNSESALVASAQPPTRMTAIRQKLQQDILSVDPVKAKIQSNSSQLIDNTPVKTTPPNTLQSGRFNRYILEPSSSSGPSTRSKSKRKPALEESSASKRSKNAVSSKEPNLFFAFKEKVKLEARTVAKNVLLTVCKIQLRRDSMSAKLKIVSITRTVMSPINLLTSPSTSSNESLWKDSVDNLLMS